MTDLEILECRKKAILHLIRHDKILSGCPMRPDVFSKQDNFRRHGPISFIF